MNQTRILSLLLCLCMLCTLILPAAATEGETTEPVSPMVVNKTAKLNPDGTYTITLEAFATGEKITSQISRDVPTDIILVLDQSGSMADKMSVYNFAPYTNKSNGDYYKLRHNGGTNPNLYHKLHEEPAGDRYTSVSVTKTVTYSVLNNLTNEDYYDYYRNNLYQKVGEEYQKVTLTYDWYFLFPNEYTYTFADGTTVTIEGDNTKPDFGARGPLYTPNADDGSTVYTYTYTDKDGVRQTIDTSTGKNTRPTNFTLYERYATTGTTTRLQALKNAVSDFVDSVNTKAMGKDGKAGTADDINHRIAVVGFASQSGNGNNTELLSIKGNNSGSVGVAYGYITKQNYRDVLQSMNTTAGQNMVNAAISVLAANGATEIDLGMNMAQQILNNNPVQEGENRNRVVVVFTDGSPTRGSGFQKSVAQSAITKANAIQTSGATVYSIGIFEGADACSYGTEPSGDLEQGDGRIPDAGNWFMQHLSSNDGQVQHPSYYLSASDADSLDGIFKQIADNIEQGGAATTLGKEAVVKDFISPYFRLPANATEKDITLKTYPCTGKNGNEYTWGTAATAPAGVTAAIGQNGEVSVKGFDFSENWCGTVTENGNVSHRGNKLEISFTVERKPDFLGGNDVPTNDLAGVYKNAADTVPEFDFPVPKVNVPIGNVSVQAQDKNVYLLDNVTADELKYGAAVTVGGVPLDLTKANDPDKPYGLEQWQMEHVNITVTIQDEKGNTISAADLQNMKDDVSYTIQVTVSPKTDGLTAAGTQATQKTDNDTKKINVFKPELTFKDLEGYYGALPDDSDNPVNNEEWKHGDTVADENTIIGPKPNLMISKGYAHSVLDATGKINTKRDIPVKADVQIGDVDVTQYTTFKHEACTSGCSWTDVDTPNGDPAFLIHVKTCTLNVTKTGGAAGEPYVFTVKKDGTPYTEVTIEGNGTQTIVELPVGTYTIAEDTGWSWRYTPSYSDDVALSATAPEGTITCTNTSKNNKWLNGFSSVVRNIFATATNN